MQKAQAAAISPAKALALLESHVEKHFDNPQDAYYRHQCASHLCLVVGDFYYFSNVTLFKLKGRMGGWFVSMKDGSITRYHYKDKGSQREEYDPPYGPSATVLLLEIGEEKRPATLAVERFNATLPEGQPPYSNKLYSIGIVSLSARMSGA